MEIIEYNEPNDPVISKSILYYYFFKTSSNTKLEFTHFPHYRTTLMFYSNANIEFDKNKMILNSNQSDSISTLLNVNKQDYKSVAIKGKQNMIGIVFQTLGINNYIRANLNQLVDNSGFFDTTIWSNFNEKIRIIFEEKSPNEKVKLLDDFFLKTYEPFENDKLKDIVSLILAKRGAVKLTELEDQFSINRRTLLRLFKTHLCCSIRDYKRTVKFRISLDEYQKKEDTNFTTLSLENNYYDQSDFINQFKSISGKIPSKVLNQISKMGEKDLFWLVDNK